MSTAIELRDTLVAVRAADPRPRWPSATAVRCASVRDRIGGVAATGVPGGPPLRPAAHGEDGWSRRLLGRASSGSRSCVYGGMDDARRNGYKSGSACVFRRAT